MSSQILRASVCTLDHTSTDWEAQPAPRTCLLLPALSLGGKFTLCNHAEKGGGIKMSVTTPSVSFGTFFPISYLVPTIPKKSELVLQYYKGYKIIVCPPD